VRTFATAIYGWRLTLCPSSCRPRLDRDASKLLRHHLASDIETAIQGSNARLEPDDVLRRLDAIIQPLKPGARGWDCFSLQYRVESPINAVLDDQAIRDYDRMFMHLWKIRRVSASLTKKWLRSTFAPRNFRTLKGERIQICN
jgi:gamma-tubulin complex component 3